MTWRRIVLVGVVGVWPTVGQADTVAVCLSPTATLSGAEASQLREGIVGALAKAGHTASNATGNDCDDGRAASRVFVAVTCSRAHTCDLALNGQIGAHDFAHAQPVPRAELATTLARLVEEHASGAPGPLPPTGPMGPTPGPGMPGPGTTHSHSGHVVVDTGVSATSEASWAVKFDTPVPPQRGIGVAIAGWSLFGSGYLTQISMQYAICANTSGDCRDNQELKSLVPVLGGFWALASEDSSDPSGRNTSPLAWAAAIATSTIQVTGLGLAAGGHTLHRITGRARRDAIERAALVPTQDGGMLVVGGTF